MLVKATEGEGYENCLINGNENCLRNYNDNYDKGTSLQEWIYPPYNLDNQYVTRFLCVHYVLFLMYYEAKLMEFSESSKFFRGKFIFLWLVTCCLV